MEERSEGRGIKQGVGEMKMTDSKKDHWGKREVVYWHAYSILVFMQNIKSIRPSL